MTPIAFEFDLGCQPVLLFETLMRKANKFNNNNTRKCKKAATGIRMNSQTTVPYPFH